MILRRFPRSPRLRSFLTLRAPPNLASKTILCVRLSIHNILGLSPSGHRPPPSPTLCLFLSLVAAACRRCRSGSPLRHISGGRKTPVSAFKISLMAAATDRADRPTERPTAFPKCCDETQRKECFSAFVPFLRLGKPFYAACMQQRLEFNRCLHVRKDFSPIGGAQCDSRLVVDCSRDACAFPFAVIG